MSEKKQKIKKFLKYHRLFALALVFTYILIRYFTTTSDDHYDNGQLKYEGRRENGFNEGRWVWYYPDGKKRLEGRFVKGKREGKWQMWNEQGKQISERNYELDKLNGLYCDWYINGQKKSEGQFGNDRLQGIIKDYDSSGHLIQQYYYRDGEKIQNQNYGRN